MRTVSFVVLGCATMLSAAAGGQSFGLSRPEGSFSTFLADLKYDPSSACIKPYRPYEMDEYARENYIREAQRYLQCLSDAAEHDTRYAKQVIADGYEEAADDFLNEVKRGY